MRSNELQNKTIENQLQNAETFPASRLQRCLTGWHILDPEIVKKETRYILLDHSQVMGETELLREKGGKDYAVD
jgi:hypothetical protein